MRLSTRSEAGMIIFSRVLIGLRNHQVECPECSTECRHPQGWCRIPHVLCRVEQKKPTRLQDVLHLLSMRRELLGFGSGETVVRRHRCDSDRPSGCAQRIHQDVLNPYPVSVPSILQEVLECLSLPESHRQGANCEDWIQEVPAHQLDEELLTAYQTGEESRKTGSSHRRRRVRNCRRAKWDIRENCSIFRLPIFVLVELSGIHHFANHHFLSYGNLLELLKCVCVTCSTTIHLELRICANLRDILDCDT